MRKTLFFRAKYFLFLLSFVVATNFFGVQRVVADPTDIFPTGPYSATLISDKILYPSLFSVPSGLPVADVTGVLLANNTIRAFVFAQNQGIVIADSTDGKTFTKVGNAFGGDKGQGMPRVIKLPGDKFRMYNMTSGGVSCSTSSDGLNFTLEKTNCISSAGYPGASEGITGVAIVKLQNGSYRAYFSDMVKAGTGPDPHQVYSATSTDGLTWVADSGIRVGPGASSITRSAEHPAAAIHADGSITLFYFDNEARLGKDSSGRQNMAMGQMGLWYSTSTDGGLNFTVENKIVFPTGFAPSFGNDPDVFLDKNRNFILWAGGFEQSIGGYIGAVTLTKDTSAADLKAKQEADAKAAADAKIIADAKAAADLKAKQEADAKAAAEAKVAADAKAAADLKAKQEADAKSAAESILKKKTTINCVKGKTTKNVTGVNPKCPSGYKKK